MNGIGVSTGAIVAGPGFFYRPLDRIVVRGRKEPVEVFEVLGTEPPAWLDDFQSGLAAFRARRWKEAKAAFLKVLEAERAGKAAA